MQSQIHLADSLLEAKIFIVFWRFMVVNSNRKHTKTDYLYTDIYIQYKCVSLRLTIKHVGVQLKQKLFCLHIKPFFVSLAVRHAETDCGWVKEAAVRHFPRPSHYEGHRAHHHDWRKSPEQSRVSRGHRQYVWLKSLLMLTLTGVLMFLCAYLSTASPTQQEKHTCVRKSLICAFAIAFIISVMLIAANQMLRRGMK